MNKFIALASPDIGKKEIALVNEVLKSGMLVQGKYVQKIEQLIAEYVGVKHAVCVSSGTATLHLILKALQIGEGDEVIVPAFSFIATANVVELVGAKPVFVDIDLQTYNLNPEELTKAITPRTKAIIVVHEFGLAANLEPIIEFSKKNGLFLIEDAACAIGGTYKNDKLGSFGIAGSFSFHPRKVITSGEGGIVTTNDDVLAEKIRVYRNHGIIVRNGIAEFIEAGFNYRMTDIQAALILPQFQRLDSIIKARNILAELYLRNLDRSLLKLPIVPSGYLHTWQTFHVILSSKKTRDVAIEELAKKGIGTNYGAQCIPETSYYSSKYEMDLQKVPNALTAYSRGLALPLYEKLTQKDIRFISNQLNQICLSHDL